MLGGLEGFGVWGLGFGVWGFGPFLLPPRLSCPVKWLRGTLAVLGSAALAVAIKYNVNLIFINPHVIKESGSRKSTINPPPQIIRNPGPGHRIFSFYGPFWAGQGLGVARDSPTPPPPPQAGGGGRGGNKNQWRQAGQHYGL